MYRFHISFDYNGGNSWDDQVVHAESIEAAARMIARERGLTSLHVRKRYFYGRPASESEVVDRKFTFDKSANRC